MKISIYSNNLNSNTFSSRDVTIFHCVIQNLYIYIYIYLYIYISSTPLFVGCLQFLRKIALYLEDKVKRKEAMGWADTIDGRNFGDGILHGHNLQSSERHFAVDSP